MAEIETLIEECQGPLHRAIHDTVEYSTLTPVEFLQVACLALERAKEDFHQQYLELAGEDS